ncbi:Permease of the drug/metabolite transporter (DMT) superfamily [hydrothermal vent metagenome]|uniref:Permease of the drug/metabolite transporter (DMT) superfamily n=1 Tax=hydrothermal vent metagenome TaxID=652676 RepID=A0A3B0U3H5_9ZZZZ
MTRKAATATGFSAVALWALLALFTAASGRVPPFQLTAMTFLIGGIIGLVWVARSGTGMAVFRQPWPVWALGVGGLFGYHFFYFTALRNAPPVEAGLIAYLWPLLIVLLSAFLPQERLRIHHIGGGVLGLAGAGLIVTGGEALHIDPVYAFGYGAALICAFVWSGYSVLSRRFAKVPTQIVAGFCLATAGLSAIAHLALERTVWPGDAGEWLAVVALGVGPVGLAFYTWDIGVKHGDIQVLGAVSYAAPLLSTAVLIGFGYSPLTWTVAAAAVLITSGAVLASKEMIFRR